MLGMRATFVCSTARMFGTGQSTHPRNDMPSDESSKTPPSPMQIPPKWFPFNSGPDCTNAVVAMNAAESFAESEGVDLSVHDWKQYREYSDQSTVEFQSDNAVLRCTISFDADCRDGDMVDASVCNQMVLVLVNKS